MSEIRLHELGLGLKRLSAFLAQCSEIAPEEQIRTSACSLLEKHSLTAADAIQLAAALVWYSGAPHGRVFICADRRLGAAAREEGFAVTEL